VAFSPDGKEIACAGDSEIRVLDVSTGEEARRFAVENIRGVAYAPDGSFLVGWGGSYSTRSRRVVRSEGFARLLDQKTGEALREFEGHEGRIFSAALSPDGKTLATSSQDNTIRIWETASGTEFRQISIAEDAVLEQGKWLPYDMTAQLAFSPENQMLAAAMPDYSIRLWETSSGKELRRLNGHEDKIQSLAFSKDGRYLVSGGRDKKVRVWETQFGASMRVYSYPGHTSWIECVAFSPDYQTVVSGSQDRTVRIFHLPARGQLHPRVAKRQRIRDASLSPDGRWYATGGSAGVYVWETETGRFLTAETYPPIRMNCVAFSPDGVHLASGSWEHGIYLWKVVEKDGRTSLEEVKRVRAYGSPVLDIAFSPDGTKLVCGGGRSNRTVRLWDLASGKEIREWTTGPDPVSDVAFAPNGRRVAALCRDALRIWDADTGELVQQIDEDQLTFRGARCIAFSPDSRTLVTGGKGENCVFRDGRKLPPPPNITIPSAIRFWDVATGETMR